jgi:hypothetical protein
MPRSRGPRPWALRRLDSREPPRVPCGSRCAARGRRTVGRRPDQRRSGDGDPPRCDLGELVRLLVVPSGHVVELDAVKLILEGPHGLTVRLHLVVVATCVFHDFVDQELRVPPHVEAFDAYLDGNFEAANQGLVLSHVVRCGEVNAHNVPHVLPEG